MGLKFLPIRLLLTKKNNQRIHKNYVAYISKGVSDYKSNLQAAFRTERSGILFSNILYFVLHPTSHNREIYIINTFALSFVNSNAVSAISPVHLLSSYVGYHYDLSIYLQQSQIFEKMYFFSFLGLSIYGNLNTFSKGKCIKRPISTFGCRFFNFQPFLI